jgi:hypothetical protein
MSPTRSIWRKRPSLRSRKLCEPLHNPPQCRRVRLPREPLSPRRVLCSCSRRRRDGDYPRLIEYLGTRQEVTVLSRRCTRSQSLPTSYSRTPFTSSRPGPQPATSSNGESLTVSKRAAPLEVNRSITLSTLLSALPEDRIARPRVRPRPRRTPSARARRHPRRDRSYDDLEAHDLATTASP